MSRSVARVTDPTPKSKIADGATSVRTNNLITAHAGSKTTRGRTVVQGSETVFVENKPIARTGDNVVKEGPILSGSTNVFAG